jgi:hypothetical protein
MADRSALDLAFRDGRAGKLGDRQQFYLPFSGRFALRICYFSGDIEPGTRSCTPGLIASLRASLAATHPLVAQDEIIRFPKAPGQEQIVRFLRL